MSKRLNNFYTVDDIEKKGFPPVVLRYALTSGAYRQTINFTMDSLHAAQSALVRLKRFSDDILGASGLKRSALLKAIGKGKHLKDDWGMFAAAWEKLSNDLNIPAALGSIFTAIKSVKIEEMDPEAAAKYAVSYHNLIYALGYDLDQFIAEKPKVDAPEEIKKLAFERWEAKQSKDWATSDQLRDALQKQGWKILDKKDGYVLEPL